MKKIVITLIALFSVLVFSQPIRADTTNSNDSERDKLIGFLGYSGPSIANGVFGSVNWSLSSDGVLSLDQGKLAMTNGENPWNPYLENVKKIVLTGKVVGNKDISSLFQGFTNLQTIVGLPNLVTTDAMYMKNVFQECKSLVSIDLSNFDTSNAIDLTGLFAGCESLTELNISNLNTSNVQYMPYMFQGCTSLSTLDVSNLNTSKVTTMAYMFHGLNITNLDLSSFDTSNVQNMSYMFYECHKLSYVHLSSFNTVNVTNMHSMFDACRDLSSLNLTNFSTSNVEDMRYMFHECRSLSELDLSSFDTSKSMDMDYFFDTAVLRNLRLGSKTALKGNVMLNTVPNNEFYTGKWQTSEGDWSGTTDQLITRSNMGFRDVTYIWQPTSKSVIIFDANGGITSQSNIEGAVNSSVDLSNVLPATREGYIFTGWYTNKEGGTKIPTNISMPAGGITYYAQWEGLLSFKEVPETLSFNESKISNRTSETLRTDPNWKMIVEDTRVDKNPWRVTAKLVEPFKNSSGESAAGNILLFRKTNASDQWITESEETNVFDGTSTKGIDDYNVSWSQDSGPIIQAAPGTVKAGEYKGVIQWGLADTPV